MVPRRSLGLADPMRAQGSVWVRPKLSSGKASSASRKSKGASPAAAAAPHILPPPNRRELHRRLRPGRRETCGPAPPRRR
ncbi:hypothetical protein SORBI_3010G177000 [Sorghum bicolor]|nr:hypothetical protein SORBI_3010G177000 [Sorghum bicolor]